MQTASPRTDARRTSTRDRIREVAMDLFVQRGWESVTLQQIADELGITRPALYYHYPSREAILASINEGLAEQLSELVAWGRSQPATPATRSAVLDRLATSLAGSVGAFMRVAQRGDEAMREMSTTAAVAVQMETLTQLLAPSPTVAGAMRARLAIEALFQAEQIKAPATTDDDRCQIALAIANDLVAS